MNHRLPTVAAAAAMLALTPLSVHAQQDMARETGKIDVPGIEQVRSLIATWTETPNAAATAMIEKYGAPHGVTNDMLVWHDTGPWTHTVVYREAVEHHFPMPHEDVLEQFIKYEVPVDKYDELAEFDGSIIVERTKGVISARCDKEGANFLALNLANDIVTGDKSVDEAREVYGETIQAMMNGESPAYMSGLAFELPQDETADPDEATIEGHMGMTRR